MSQIFAGIAAVQKGRLQDGIACKSALDSRGEDTAACLGLQIFVSADVIRVGMGIVNGLQLPAPLVQKLPHPPARVLVVPAVDQADLCVVQPDQPDLRRALDIIIVL